MAIYLSKSQIPQLRGRAPAERRALLRTVSVKAFSHWQVQVSYIVAVIVAMLLRVIVVPGDILHRSPVTIAIGVVVIIALYWVASLPYYHFLAKHLAEADRG